MSERFVETNLATQFDGGFWEVASLSTTKLFVCLHSSLIAQKWPE